MEPAVRCAAAPVRNHRGQVVSAISISGTSSRIEGDHLRNVLVPAVLQAAQGISKELGGPAVKGMQNSIRKPVVKRNLAAYF